MAKINSESFLFLLILILSLESEMKAFAQKGSNFGFRSKDETVNSCTNDGLHSTREFGTSFGELFQYASNSTSSYIFKDSQYIEKIRGKERLIQDRTETYEKKKIKVQSAEENARFNKFFIERSNIDNKTFVIDSETARRMELVFYNNINNNIRWKKFLWPVLTSDSSRINDFNSRVNLPTDFELFLLQKDQNYGFDPGNYGLFRYFNGCVPLAKQAELSLFNTSKNTFSRKNIFFFPQ